MVAHNSSTILKDKSSIYYLEEKNHLNINSGIAQAHISLEERTENSHLSVDEIDSILKEVKKVKKRGKIPVAELNTVPNTCTCKKNRIPISKLRIAEEKVSELEKEGLVVRTERNNWLNPIYLVKNPDGSYKLDLDLRGLNLLSIQSRFLVSNITMITDEVKDMRYFTKLCVKDGFSKVPLAAESQQKTTFKIGTACYRFTTLPAGYKNAPNILQRIMEIILDHLLGNICAVYIDDIVIYSKDLNMHTKNIKAVMIKLKEYGMEINWEKTEIAKTKIDFLGHCIEHNSVRPLVCRVQGISEYPEPKTKKQLGRFIGLLAHNRGFLIDISKTIEPLYNLTRKGELFEWTQIHKYAFEEAKQKLIAHTHLVIPDYKKSFTLETHASDTGIGAVLRQGQEAIAYYSATLTEEQKDYTSTEKELYASIRAMERYKYYLQGVQFDLVVGHRAIQYYYTKPDFGNSRIRKWHQILQRYNFVPQYKPREEMVQSDALSRSLRYVSDEEAENNESSVLARVYNIINTALTEQEELILEKHREWEHRKRIQKALSISGIEVTQKELKKVLDKCMVCLQCNNEHIRPSSHIEAYEPGEVVSIHLMEYENMYIIVMIDCFSKKIFTKSVLNKKEGKILMFIKKVYDQFQFKKLLSSREPEFTNKHLMNWLDSRGIEQGLRPVYETKERGGVQKLNYKLAVTLDKNNEPLGVKLVNATENYNNRTHGAFSRLKITPNQALLQKNWKRIREETKKHKTELKAK